jgi:hypothetical protein
MKAIIKLNGKAAKALSYNTSTVTLATRSGKPDIITWADVDYLVGDDGLERHRDTPNGLPTIIVQPPPDSRWQPYQSEALPPQESPQNDFEDVVALIDAIDNEDARVAVCAALAVCFEGEAKRRFWGVLSFEQKRRLKK